MLATPHRWPCRVGCPHADAGLKALFARWQAKEREVNGTYPLSDEEGDRLVDELNDIEREIFAHPATGIEALKIKARVAKQYLIPFEHPPDENLNHCLDDIGMRSLLAAIEAL